MPKPYELIIFVENSDNHPEARELLRPDKYTERKISGKDKKPKSNHC
tara:strand:+ start:428 stop:568 length:141 start_codon:yes stop_codon:yes gene_type:complete